MAGDPIVRPEFFEGQILAAGDLRAGLDYTRGREARHDRYLHTWGIATGLELVGKPAAAPDGTQYQVVTLSQGVAINGSGREIVVPEPEPVDPELFASLNVVTSDPNALYPVFVVGHDAAVSAASSLFGACGTSGTTRVTEGFEITFGAPGDVADLDLQEDLSDVSAGPDGGDGASEKVLVGFVKFNTKITQFTQVALRSAGPNVVTLRYAGARADEIVPRGGALALRTGARGAKDSPAVVLDASSKDRSLRFGVQDAQGDVTPVFTISSQGDVWAAGTLKPDIASGVQVEIGIATDGAVLPLPSGIDEGKVTGGQMIVRTLVTPRAPLPGRPTAVGSWVPITLEAYAGADRVLRSQVMWLDTKGVEASVIVFPPCDYVVVATAAAKQAGA